MLHLLLPDPVELYSMTRHLFACRGDWPGEGLPTVVELPVEAFALHRSVHAVPQAYHVSHPEEVSPPDCRVQAGGEAIFGNLGLGVLGIDLRPLLSTLSQS